MDRRHPETHPLSVETMPKAELHRHLEGCLSPELILEVAGRFGAPVPTTALDQLRQRVVLLKPLESLQEVLTCFELFQALFLTPEVARYVAGRVVDDAARDRVQYLELRFSPGFMAHAHQLNLADVIEAVIEGTNESAGRNDIHASLIATSTRELGPDVCMETFRLAARYRPSIVAVDLAGDEDNYGPELFVKAFDFARDQGLGITVHAAEQSLPENVRRSVELLHARRIGHGIRIWGEEELVALVRKKQVALEISITSNYIVSAVSALEEHPICRLREAGVPVTINTDDPALFGTTLSEELKLFARLCGLSLADLIQNQLDSLRYGFASEENKERARRRMLEWQNRL